MRFPDPLTEGRLIRRYKRFLADVEIAGEGKVTAHCPNSGSMTGLAEPGSIVILSRSANPDRKYRYTWELVRVGRGWVGVHTGRPNQLVEEAIRGGRISELSGYAELRREVPYGKNSRIDLLLTGKKGLCYVEVKNTTLYHEGFARFPDAVTERGQKHIKELARMVAEGHRAVLVFLVNRSDCGKMGPADHVDPQYGKLLRWGAEEGVELLAYRTKITKREIAVEKPLPVDLSEYSAAPEGVRRGRG